MKYLYIGAAVLAAVLAGSLLCGAAVGRTLQAPLDALEQALAAADAGESEAATEHGASAKAAWERGEAFLCSILSHEELDAVKTAFAELESYGVTRSEEEFRRCCAVLITQLEHIAAMDKPLLYNFLSRPIGTCAGFGNAI